MIYPHLRNARGFFSDYYLGSVFSRGAGRRKKRISDRETDAAYRRLTRIHMRAEPRVSDVSSTRELFIRPFLRDVLGYHLGEGQDRIYPAHVDAESEASGQKPLAIVYCGGWDEDLNAGRGQANPVSKLGRALASGELPYGVLVTGERLRLVRAPGEGPRGAYLEADLSGLVAEEDPESFAAVYRLLHASQLQPDADGARPIAEIERESRKHAEKVSDDLKRAVFEAAESLVRGLLATAVYRGEIDDLTELPEDVMRNYRDAALTALYRILFILYAEARDVRLESHRLYRESYSIHGLVEELLRNSARFWPENRSTLWSRLKAVFRIYNEGLPQISEWEHIPPRGGDFFDSSTPQGEILDTANLPDRSVAQMLLDLATTVPRRGVGRERVSFRELDIENLGAVYEGLLEYEPRIARETTIEVRVQGKVYALVPSELVRLCDEKSLVIKGELDIVARTEAEQLHPDASGGDEEALDLEADDDVDQQAHEETEEEKGVKKGATARLLRRLEAGDFHFVPGPARKGSGSFYTPLPLVQDLVRHAVGPQAVGKTVAEIENLRVLDPACGSAHFLVEAMRFMGRELHRAYVEEYEGGAPPTFSRGEWDNDWQATDEEARAANSETRAWCKRRIAERSLFGVDLNPTAIGLAHVSLWIESLAGDRPLTYFEHHVRCGNSILGTWLDRLDTPPLPNMRQRQSEGQLGIFAQLVREAIQDAARARLLIDRASDEQAIEADSLEELDFKERQRALAEATLAGAKLLFDLRSASAFVPEIWNDWNTLCSYIDNPERLRTYAKGRGWWPRFVEVRDRERFFHWELEFPEIFLDPENAGFDAVLGNPPWGKVKPDKKEFYGRYDILIRAYVGGDLDRRIRELHDENPDLANEFDEHVAHTKTLAASLKRGSGYRFVDWKIDGRTTGGDPDVFKFFVERAHRVTRAGGRVGVVVPSAIYNNEGCTGLRHLLLDETQVERFYGFENRKKIFPIDSRYKFVSLVFRKGQHEGDGFEAAFMRHDLDELTDHKPKPWTVLIKRSELERLSPGTLAFLEYRSPKDREIILKMYEGRPLLGDQGPGTWNAHFYNEFHMTNDRDLWTDPNTGKLWTVKQILGFEPVDFQETRERMAEKGFWPLYEGKHIEQFLIDIKPIERWVSLEVAKRKYGHTPTSNQKLVVRAIASNTNERTLVSAIIPERSCFGHSLYGYEGNANPLIAQSFLNSLVVDYSIRFRVSSNVSPTYLKLIPIVELPSFVAIPIRSGLTINHVSDLTDEWRAIWHSNCAVAKAYGLAPSDLDLVLGSFPVFARKRPEFFAFLKQKMAEWKEEV